MAANICVSQMQLDWVKRFNSPQRASGIGLAIDDSGNVYVTGSIQFSSSLSCITIKYNKFGDEKWVRQYQKPGESYNQGYDITIGDSGNIFLAGASSLLKYSPSGDLLLTKYDSADFNKIAIDSNGYIFAAGIGYGKFVIAKYSQNGVRIWKDNSVSGYRLNDLIIDKRGNIIITGEKQYAGTAYDYATIKYSNNGNLIWIRSYNGPAPQPSYDFSNAVAADNQCNVYVTGASPDTNSLYNCVTIKYDSAGNTIWLKRIYPPPNAYDIAVDELENVYLASRGDGYNYTTKLNIYGNLLWSRTYRAAYEFAVNPNLIYLDSVNNVYMSANIDSISETSYAALKYDNVGNRIFLVAYGYNSTGFNYVNDMVIGKDGSVYLTGESNFAGATVKFSEINTSISTNIVITARYFLSQNYPNPFNPGTVISYSLLVAGEVKLIVYDLLGKEISTLVNQKQDAGNYSVEFNASNLPSGVYFYRLEADKIIETKRMVLLK